MVEIDGQTSEIYKGDKKAKIETREVVSVVADNVKEGLDIADLENELSSYFENIEVSEGLIITVKASCDADRTAQGLGKIRELGIGLESFLLDCKESKITKKVAEKLVLINIKNLFLEFDFRTDIPNDFFAKLEEFKGESIFIDWGGIIDENIAQSLVNMNECRIIEIACVLSEDNLELVECLSQNKGSGKQIIINNTGPELSDDTISELEDAGIIVQIY
ncbi:MAG: hypothetical protein N4A38_05675 [Candidatus Gracilibacteria bacterium]|nr:hypothetical protein [Candidatus Gracilibacteria bacterium]